MNCKILRVCVYFSRWSGMNPKKLVMSEGGSWQVVQEVMVMDARDAD